MHKYLLLLVMTVVSLKGFAQKIALPAPLNVALSFEKNPSVTADGKYMLLESDYGDEGNFFPMLSKRVGNNWTRPVELTSLWKGVVWNGGFNLSPDGNWIVYSSNRAPNVGGKDILISSRISEEEYTKPENPGAPLNTKGNEVDPALSPDNQNLFFIRADKEVKGKDCGKIYVAEKSPTTWKEPKALPGNVNTGCNCAVRMLADNKTIIFASDRPGGKGGFDVYMSVQQHDGSWSDPKNMDFVNTAGDEIYVTMQADGRYLFAEGEKYERTDIFQYKVPANFMPKKTIWMNGNIFTADLRKPTTAKIFVTGLNSGKEFTRIYNKPADGSFFLVLAEDEPMNVTIYPFEKPYSYGSFFVYPEQYGDHFSVTSEEVALTKLSKDKALVLLNVEFDEDMKSLTKEAKAELDKLAYIMKENSAVKFEVGAHIDEFKEDSVRTTGLTEVRYDTIIVKEIITKTIMVTDTAAMQARADSLAALPDSLKQVSSAMPPDQPEEILMEKVVTDTLEKEVVKVMYHNDYTPRLANTVQNYLQGKGVSASRIKSRGYGDRKKSRAGGEFNNRVEISVL